MTAFFVILRQISTAFDIQCEKCCRFMSKYIVEKNCCRKTPSKNVGEKYCQNILSKKTVIDSVFRQILTKNLKNFVECRSILAKNVVEKNVVEFYDSTPFSDGFFRQKILSKNEVKKCCRKKLI